MRQQMSGLHRYSSHHPLPQQEGANRPPGSLYVYYTVFSQSEKEKIPLLLRYHAAFL